MANPTELTLGSSFTVRGSVGEGSAPLSGQTLTLEASPYPYKAWQPAGTGVSAADGNFQIAVPALQGNERLRVLDTTVAGVSSPTIDLLVDPRVALAAASLGPGRTRLSARIAHLSGVSSPPTAARWYVATRGSDTYHLAATTETHELPGAVTYASAIVDPPAKRFTYRVCLNPPWEAAMGPAASHGACPPQGFHLPAAAKSSAGAPRAHAAFEFGGEARGTPLAPFPSAAAIASARSFLAARAGRTSLAVLDSAGHLSGLHLREHFQTASVVKVMFLTAYLQMLEAHHRGLSASDRALLFPMIHESNNDDASAVLAAVGGAAVARVAREAGMRDYAPGVGWWAFSQTSAQDQASFMMQLAHLIPARFYGYARYLMATIEAEQSWGFPPVARPRWNVFFKTGALPSEGLFNEVALLEKGPLRFTVAVFTDGDPSMAYGEQTIEGVAERLLVGS
ncbi:MAG TPA: serine hydrolase [Solirubrobacteraceae bacterium]|nr:serine hydrolase [Solirubrobacteraceae bacterium]